MTGRGPIVSGIHILEQPPDWQWKIHLQIFASNIWTLNCQTSLYQRDVSRFLLVSSPFSMVYLAPVSLLFSSLTSQRCSLWSIRNAATRSIRPGLSRHWSGRGSRGSDSRRWSGGFCLHGWHWFGPLAATAKVLTHFGSENPVSSWLNSKNSHTMWGPPVMFVGL